MRVGNNIAKDQLISYEVALHRLVFPLHIPYQNDYYQEAYQIFEYALFSARKTSVTALKISVVSNASCKEVNAMLFELYQQGFIDELIIEPEPLGKINSLLKVLRHAQEALITVVDADVLFLNGWETAVFEVFEAFPKAGAVSPVPIFYKHFHLTANIWLRFWRSKKLYFRPVKNPAALQKFANSIGWTFPDDTYKTVIATLKTSANFEAVVGCPHFVATYKREVFKQLPLQNSRYQLGGNSEHDYLDLPVIKAGGYRLSTTNNYAYHLGNTLEDWMATTFNHLEDVSPKINRSDKFLTPLKPNRLTYFLAQHIFAKLFYLKAFKRFLLKLKGLNPTQIKTLTQ